MLSELCQELKNWFDRGQPHLYGAFEIRDGKIVDADFVGVIQPNQYFRIQGSVFNDGVYKNTEELALTDELFVGAVSLMAIPKDVIELADEITAWRAQYAETLNSPYSSESFGGYSYTKASAGTGNGSGNGCISWQSFFGSRLNKWRKI